MIISIIFSEFILRFKIDELFIKYIIKLINANHDDDKKKIKKIINISKKIFIEWLDNQSI